MSCVESDEFPACATLMGPENGRLAVAVGYFVSGFIIDGGMVVGLGVNSIVTYDLSNMQPRTTIGNKTSSSSIYFKLWSNF
ncbi:hypothetical protein CEXT_797011 [Caerostris extrusa]|uniref:Uncharacterized protein n=1 Tax=Caerostris extrusa TaxID=172846 RepID=A0AAV4QDR5_CAEEX|nr:hypothetical protein CEXT_797011 [Caerostris extrusa]